MYLTPIDQIKTIKIIPIPILVIKSLIVSPSTLQNVKIFINLCHSDNVPQPKTPFDPLTTFTQIMNNEWEIPIVTSPQRWDQDKKHQQCLVYDCVISSECCDDLENVEELKQILVEWCIESCELADNLIIDRDHVKFPKLRYKGKNGPVPFEIKSSSIDDTDGVENGEPLDNTFTQWKNDLLFKQELEDERNSLKTLFPQQQTFNKPLIQEIPSSESIIKAQNMSSSSEIKSPKSKSKLNFSVSMRKTFNTEKWKLRIQIDILNENNDPISSLDPYLFHCQYDPKNNNLRMYNNETSIFKPNEIIIPLPNLYKSVTKYTKQSELFFIKDKSKLIIFI